jgi:hypothetical protein
MSRRWLVAAVAAAATAAVASAAATQDLFSTTLHGAPTEVIEPGTAGASTLQLQPWLTAIDPDVRCRARPSRAPACARANCARALRAAAQRGHAAGWRASCCRAAPAACLQSCPQRALRAAAARRG